MSTATRDVPRCGTVLRERGARQVVVQLDGQDGEYICSRADEFSPRAVAGDRVRLVGGGNGSRPRAVLDGPSRAEVAPPMAPAKPLPETLRRAVLVELAAGDSPFTIAARHGLDLRQVPVPTPGTS
jgi:hypothetical protein